MAQGGGFASSALADLGGRMAAALQAEPKTSRAEFYQGLAPKAKTALVVVLHSRGFPSEVIASDLGLNVHDVLKTTSAYADELGAQVVGMRLNTIAGNLLLAKDRAQAAELAAGNGKAAFSIEKDFVKLLQDLGVVDRAAHKFEHEHTVNYDDEKAREIDAMLELERKKEAAHADVKVIEANVVDEIPPDTILENL